MTGPVYLDRVIMGEVIEIIKRGIISSLTREIIMCK